ncbi:MAG: hypothetical protein ABSB01_03585 [Streptosporangiaceae bacterium]
MIKRHVSAAEIARFSEGDIRARKAARIGSHLAGCRRCARVREDLARVPALLASTEAPPMPEHLTARIQAALSTESARRASLDAGPDSAQPERRAGGWSWPRLPGMSARAAGWAAAAAAAVVVAGGGTYLIVQGQGGGGTSASSAAVPSGAAHRTAAGANVPAAPAVRGTGQQLEYQRAGKTTEFTPVASDKNYLPAKLAAQVNTTLTDHRTPASSSPAKAAPLATANLSPKAGSGRSSRIGGFSVGALEGCVSRVSAGAMVLLVDVASYQSTPAAVIVTAVNEQRPKEAWVVGTGCSASDSDVLNRATLPPGG